MRCKMKQGYRIRIQGHLGDDWSDWFAGLHMTRLATGETELSGPLDQAALHGVLSWIRDLNLLLVAVIQIDEAMATNTGDTPEEGKEQN